MYYNRRSEEVMNELETRSEGLSEEKVVELRGKYGFNEIAGKKKKSLLKLFIESLNDPLIIVLIIVSVVQILLGHIEDALIIVAVLIMNAILNVVQGRKAEASLDAVKKLLTPVAKVSRNGEKMVIQARDLVPGDIVFLDTGDFIPADGRLIEAESLKINESILTGESVPAEKISGILEGERTILDMHNSVFSGTIVVNGRGKYVVTSTALNTEIGKVAKSISETAVEPTVLQRKLEDFTKQLGKIIFIVSLFIFVLLIGKHILKYSFQNIGAAVGNAFIFAIAVAVAAIPEALSSVTAIVLSLGSIVMSKKNAIIRNLSSVETLGAVSVICTDKTGTLTQNNMTVVGHYLVNVDEFNFLEKSKQLEISQEKYFILANALVNDASIEGGKEIGDPTEIALLKDVEKFRLDNVKVKNENTRKGEIPFDSDRKLMSTLNNVNGRDVVFTKGAPDILLENTNYYLLGDKIEKMDPETKKEIGKKLNEYALEGLRVLAFAFKFKEIENDPINVSDEKDMIFLGLTAMIDPPKENVFETIQEAEAAGIKVIMITGDNKLTAQSIARELGIARDGDIVLEGKELDLMTDSELDEKLEKISVYARVTPDNKLRIVKAWKKKNKIVSMTGDGVNDGPSLREADMGVAMGSGTEVAKEAAEMILTDDNFTTIIHAVEIGRTVYQNIKKAVFYLFTGNLGAIVVIIAALVMGLQAPLTAVQILFINLINDSIPAIALGFEPVDIDLMKKPPRNINEEFFTSQDYRIIFSRGIVIGMISLIAFYIGGFDTAMGTAMVFTTLVFSRTLQTFASRDRDKTIIEKGLTTNKYTLMAVGICFGIFSLTQIPVLKKYFSIPENFGMKEIGISLILAILSLVICEMMKKIKISK